MRVQFVLPSKPFVLGDGFVFTVNTFVELEVLRATTVMRNLPGSIHTDMLTNVFSACDLSVSDDNGRLFWPPEKPVVLAQDVTTTYDATKVWERVAVASPHSDFKPYMTYTLPVPKVEDFLYFAQVQFNLKDAPVLSDLVFKPELAPRNPAWERESKKFREANPACLVCGTTADCQVHHKYPVHLHPEKEMDPTFWRTLCRVHHLWFGHLGSWYSYNESIDEDVKLWHGKIFNRPKGTVPAG